MANEHFNKTVKNSRSMSHKTPSRKRYEKKNPTVAFRIDKEIKEKLDKMLEGLDMTKKDWLEKTIQNDRIDYNEAYNEGYEEAEEEYKVEYPCKVCGEPMPVASEEVKETIWEILYKLNHEKYIRARDLHFGWGHEECHEK